MRNIAIGLVAAALLGSAAACGSAPASPATVSPAGSPTGASAGSVQAPAAQVAHADSLRGSWVQADADFMTGMIHHHAQALVMAQLAPTHGASASLRVLAARIINAQNDEIALMQQWLRDRGLPAPDPAHMTAAGHGDNHAVHMPGMLTPGQLERLAAARGPEFERLFLSYMIQHHEGATTMVDRLFDTYGAAQGDAIFKIASDIGVDQATEIERMRSMLHELLFESGTE